MRFASVKMSNYRQYKSLEFQFPEQGDNDIHAIIASNGVGKTNLLNAINWCLYGKEPHADITETDVDYDDSDEDRLTLANIEAIEEAAAADKKTCTVTVSIKIENETQNGIETAEITRQVEVNVKTYFIAGEDKFEVKITKSNGEGEFLYGKEAKEYVDGYLPESIREYFFFDGEQLLKYFDVKKKKHIEASINSIAKIDSLQEVTKHLKILIDEYRKALKKNDPQMEAKEKALSNAEANVAAKEQDINDLITAIAVSEQTIQEMDAIILGTEGLVEDTKNYNNNTERINTLNDKREKLFGRLKAIIREYTVILMMYQANKTTLDYIETHVEEQEEQLDIDIRAIKKTLETGHCSICDDDISDGLRERLQSMVDKYDQTGGSGMKLTEIKNDIYRAVTKAKDYKSEKEVVLSDIAEVEDEIDELEAENSELQGRIKKYSESSIEEVQVATEAKFEQEELLKRNREKLGAYREKLKTLQDIQKQASDAFNKAREANAGNAEINEKLSFVSRAYEICMGITGEIVTDVQRKMSRETKQLFDQLIWKKETYGDIELTSDYRLKIYNKRNGQSCLKNLSDSEKELLTLAFTISLQNVSGYQSILFIDTPVGRVSDENRTKFAEVLLEVSRNKQIILAFTPSEFKDEIERVFTDDVLTSKYKLERNEVVAKAVRSNG